MVVVRKEYMIQGYLFKNPNKNPMYEAVEII